MNSPQTPNYLYESVELSQINFGNNKFCLIPETKITISNQLEESIKAFGLLHPPILKKEHNEYIVVDGRKRLLTCRNTIRQTACGCLIVPHHLTDEQIIKLRLSCLLTERPPSIAEQACFLDKLSTAPNNEETAATILFSILKIKASKHYLNRLRNISKLDVTIQADLHDGLLSEAIIDQFMRLNQQDRAATYAVIKELGLGKGKQKKLIAACHDLATRNDCSIKDILSDSEVSELFKQSRGNLPQQAANLLTWLSRKQSPLLTEAEQEFKKFSTALDMTGNMNLLHSKSFENDTVTLSVTFRNRAELTRNWGKIKTALES